MPLEASTPEDDADAGHAASWLTPHPGATLTNVVTVCGMNFRKKKPGAHRHSASATCATAVVLVFAGHAAHVAFPSAGL